MYLKGKVRMYDYVPNLYFSPSIYSGFPTEVWLLTDTCYRGIIDLYFQRKTDVFSERTVRTTSQLPLIPYSGNHVRSSTEKGGEG